MTFAQNH